MKNTLMLILFTFSISSCVTLEEAAQVLTTSMATPLTNGEIKLGLKEALKVGLDRAVEQASQKNSYLNNQAVKILFPPEALKVEKSLRKLGMDSLCDSTIKKLNESAVLAAKKATPIFLNAITTMSIEDALSLLNGGPNAATNFLRKKTEQALIAQYKPAITQSLNQVGAPNIWAQTFNTYNKIPFVKTVNTDLVSYTTTQALDGLFHFVAEQEKGIRENPALRTTALLKKVFANK